MPALRSADPTTFEHVSLLQLRDPYYDTICTASTEATTNWQDGTLPICVVCLSMSTCSSICTCLLDLLHTGVSIVLPNYAHLFIRPLTFPHSRLNEVANLEQLE